MSSQTDLTYDYSRISDQEKAILPQGFKGNVYNMSYKWTCIVPLPSTDHPIKIMEIGVYHGANVCSYMKTYATHPQTEVHCVDPWMDYIGYDEYQKKQPTNYSIFIHNISCLDPVDLNKIHLHRKRSEDALPEFSNDTFDLIYVDGNHLKAYVLEDAVLASKKVKVGGWLVFDDAFDREVNEALAVFLQINSHRFTNIQMANGQLYMCRCS